MAKEDEFYDFYAFCLSACRGLIVIDFSMQSIRPEEQEYHAKLKAMFPKMVPTNSAPSLFTLNGCGLKLYGSRDQHPQSDSYVTTLFITLIFIPIFPIKAYRVVASSSNSYYFLGKEPLSTLCRLYRRCVLIAFMLMIGLFSWKTYVTSEGYLNRKQIVACNQLLSSQQWSKATAQALYLVDNPQVGADALQIVQKANEGAFHADPSTLRGYLHYIALQSNREQLLPGFSDRLLSQALSYQQEYPADAMDLIQLLTNYPGKIDPNKIHEARMSISQSWWTKSPNDVNASCNYVIEREDSLEESKQREILLPFQQNPFLLDSEAARILGGILFRENRYQEAKTLLSRYNTPRMQAFHRAVENYESVMTKRQDFYISQLDRGLARDFDFAKYEKAKEDEQNNMVNHFLVEKFKSDPAVQQALAAQEESGKMVAPVMQLGIVELNLSRDAESAEARKLMLESAEKTFLSVRGAVGDTDEYRLFLGEVSYWLGKHDEGKKLFDELLESNKRSSEWMMEVGERLRTVGEVDMARAILDEAWTTEKVEATKKSIAASRQIMAIDSEDRMKWLQRCDQSQAYVKTAIHENAAYIAQEAGRMKDAITEYKAALVEYKNLSESSSKFNNEALVWQSLARLTGSIEDFRSAVGLMERSLLLEQNSITLQNLASSYASLANWQLNQKIFDLTKIPELSTGSLSFSMCKDAQQYQAMVKEYLSLPEVEKSLKLSAQSQVMSPKSPTTYAEITSYYLISKNDTELTKLLEKIIAAKLSFSELYVQSKEYYAGKFSDSDRDNLEKSIQHYRGLMEAIPEAMSSPSRTILEVFLIGRENTLRKRGKSAVVEPVASLLERGEKLLASNDCLCTRELVRELLCDSIVESLRKDPEIDRLFQRKQWQFTSEEFITLLHLRSDILPKLVGNEQMKRVYMMNNKENEVTGNDSSLMQFIWSRSCVPDQTEALKLRIVQSKLKGVSTEIGYELAPYSTHEILYRHILALASDDKVKAQAVLDSAKAQGIVIFE